MYRVPPYRLTDMLTQDMSWVARCHPDTTTAWPQPSRGPKTCPKRGRVPITKLAVRATAVYPAKATAARSPPTLVTTRKGSPPAFRIKACPYRRLWLHEKSSILWHSVNVQIRYMSITTFLSYHEHVIR